MTSGPLNKLALECHAYRGDTYPTDNKRFNIAKGGKKW